MIDLKEIFKHDGTVEDIVLRVKSKTLQFCISNYIENLNNYKSTIITFYKISNIRINQFLFIDQLTHFGFDIINFDEVKLDNGLHQFEIILTPGFAEQDVKIQFDYNRDDIKTFELLDKVSQ